MLIINHQNHLVKWVEVHFPYIADDQSFNQNSDTTC